VSLPKFDNFWKENWERDSVDESNLDQVFFLKAIVECHKNIILFPCFSSFLFLLWFSFQNWASGRSLPTSVPFSLLSIFDLWLHVLLVLLLYEKYIIFFIAGKLCRNQNFWSKILPFAAWEWQCTFYGSKTTFLETLLIDSPWRYWGKIMYSDISSLLS
jgi:hypothetical protein